MNNTVKKLLKKTPPMKWLLGRINKLENDVQQLKKQNSNLRQEMKYLCDSNTQGDLNVIRTSPYWDESWYLSCYEKVKQLDIDPSMHYLRNGINGNNPGPIFNSREYLLLNPDVKATHLNPLVHYEKFKYERERAVSLADIKECQFPGGTENFSKVFRNRESFNKRIVTVVAYFSDTGKVEDYIIYLLKGIREISDYIILACDNPLFPEETTKLENICDVCLCERHGERSFGSYKRGIFFVGEQKIFTEEDELLLINDFSYGPLHSFTSIVEKLHKLKKDFYGLSAGRYPREFIQNFLYLFSYKVWRSEVFQEFFKKVKKELSPSYVAFNYEMMLTKILSDAGFSWDTLVPIGYFKGDPLNYSVLPTTSEVKLLKEHLYPLIKITILQNGSSETRKDILEYIKQENPELYGIIILHLAAREAAAKRKDIQLGDICTLRKHYEEQVLRLREKSKTAKLKVVFLVSMSAMFPGQRLMEKMLEDSLFDIELYVIPEIRFGEKEVLRFMNESYRDLASKYPFVKLAVDLKDGEIVAYNDVVKDADLICYPSPYDVSYSLYNPYYAVQNNILSLHINYGFAHVKYNYYVWQLYNYNNFWKVFMETEFSCEEYRKYGRCGACNAELVGYAKMDRLANVDIPKSNIGRKKIIIAPHHSVGDGWGNERLLLSNFKKYAELFLKIPEDYPQIDFIFRPHPSLFNVLRKESQWGEKRCNEYLEKMCSLPNVKYSIEGDYMDIFAQSDGIIQDCSSFLAEYFYVGKPCCYMLKEETDIENKFLDFGKECLKHCYIAYEEEDIKRFLDEVILGGKDPKKESREKFRHDVVMLNYPYVTDIILDKLKKELTNPICSAGETL